MPTVEFLENLLPLVCLHGSFQAALCFLEEEIESVLNILKTEK